MSERIKYNKNNILWCISPGITGCAVIILYNINIISEFKLHSIYQNISNIFKTIIEIL